MSWLPWIPYFVELLRRRTCENNLISREMYEHSVLCVVALYYHCILFYLGSTDQLCDTPRASGHDVTDRVSLLSCVASKLPFSVVSADMPTSNVQVLLAQDIPDPTDFSATDLRQLDASFRCTICGEFFDAPISLACGHCFCSLVRSNEVFSGVTSLRAALLVHTRTHRKRTGMSKLSEICCRSTLQGKPSSRRGRLGLESGSV